MTKCHTNKIRLLTDNIIKSNMKNTWQQLKPYYQIKIRQASHKFNTAKRLKYTLMASDGWYDLQLNTIRDILMFTDKHSYDVNGADIMYGNEFLKSE